MYMVRYKRLYSKNIQRINLPLIKCYSNYYNYYNYCNHYTYYSTSTLTRHNLAEYVLQTAVSSTVRPICDVIEYHLSKHVIDQLPD